MGSEIVFQPMCSASFALSTCPDCLPARSNVIGLLFGLQMDYKWRPTMVSNARLMPTDSALLIRYLFVQITSSQTITNKQ